MHPLVRTRGVPPSCGSWLRGTSLVKWPRPVCSQLANVGSLGFFSGCWPPKSMLCFEGQVPRPLLGEFGALGFPPSVGEFSQGIWGQSRAVSGAADFSSRIPWACPGFPAQLISKYFKQILMLIIDDHWWSLMIIDDHWSKFGIVLGYVW